MTTKRLAKFTSVFGENWVVGRYLLPKLQAIGTAHTGVVLDLACGESPFREFFIAQKYIRIDRNPSDGEVIDADMRSIPLPDRSVDLAIVSQALSDVPKPIDVLCELARVLRPGGRIVVFESMCYPEHDMPHDYYRLMPAGLAWLANESGLRMAELTCLGGLFTRFASLWASYVMSGLKHFAVLRPVAAASIAMSNLACYGLDKLTMRPRLASDYIAILTTGETPA